MNGDRPVVDGRNSLEFELQDLIREALETGWSYGDWPKRFWTENQSKRYNKKLHELLISYLDGPTGNMGPQDEASEEGTMGDGVRQEEYIERWYEGEIPEGWKKSPNAIASDFFRQYSGQYRRLQNPR